jgi:hypothetical protein
MSIILRSIPYCSVHIYIYIYIVKKEDLCIFVIIFKAAFLDVNGIFQHQTDSMQNVMKMMLTSSIF